MICSLLGSIIYNFDIPLNLGRGILCLGYRLVLINILQTEVNISVQLNN